MSDRYRERTPWTLDETEKVAHLFGIEVSDLTARPKGFEPLTFWLGAWHVITGVKREGEPWWVDLFCDACGWAEQGCAGRYNAVQYAGHHARSAHNADWVGGVDSLLAERYPMGAHS